MKKLFWVVLAILTSAGFYSCTKNTNEPITEEQAVQNLVASGNFVDFTGRFISDFSALMQYHRSASVQANRTGFLSQVKSAGTSDASLSGAYQMFSLNYETAIALKNKVDNDILTLLNQNKFLLRFSEEQIQRILMNAMDAGVHSEQQAWQAARKNFRLDLRNGINSRTIVPDGLGRIAVNKMAELTLDEVWGCVKSAIGVGAAGILGIAGMTKLAEQGIQQVVVAASKWIAERVGWFGLAITLIDFGVCVYNETKD